MVKDNQILPPRQLVDVLIVSHPDGNLEAFAERGIDIHLARVPAAFSRQAEHQAEAVASMLMPLRFRELWRRDRLRTTGTTRPLLPSVLQRAIGTRESMRRLSAVLEVEL